MRLGEAPLRVAEIDEGALMVATSNVVSANISASAGERRNCTDARRGSSEQRIETPPEKMKPEALALQMEDGT